MLFQNVKNANIQINEHDFLAPNHIIDLSEQELQSKIISNLIHNKKWLMPLEENGKKHQLTPLVEPAKPPCVHNDQEWIDGELVYRHVSIDGQTQYGDPSYGNDLPPSTTVDGKTGSMLSIQETAKIIQQDQVKEKEQKDKEELMKNLYSPEDLKRMEESLKESEKNNKKTKNKKDV